MSPTPRRADERSARATRGLALIAVLAALLATAGLTLGRMTPHPTPAAAARDADAGPYDLRLSGSSMFGEALVPALVEAWLVSRGAQEVDVSQHKSGAIALPERVVSTRLGEHTVRIVVRAYGDQSGPRDLASGRADIEIGERRSPGPRLLLLTSSPPTGDAKAFIGFVQSDAGQAIVDGAAFGACRTQPPRRSPKTTCRPDGRP